MDLVAEMGAVALIGGAMALAVEMNNNKDEQNDHHHHHKHKNHHHRRDSEYDEPEYI